MISDDESVHSHSLEVETTPEREDGEGWKNGQLILARDTNGLYYEAKITGVHEDRGNISYSISYYVRLEDTEFPM